MDFIDKAIEKQRTRLSTGKAKQKTEPLEMGTEAVQRREREVRELVDQCITKTILPVVIHARNRIEQNRAVAEAEMDASTALDGGGSHAKGVKLQLQKGIRKNGPAMVMGPSLSFFAAPPYSTTINILAYGDDNQAIFSERWELEEVTEEIVQKYIRKFVEEVIR